MLKAVYMLKNGVDMAEGTLVRWLKEVGEPVEAGDPIMEIKTDKVTMEAEAPASGILLEKLYEDGAVVPVLSVLGWIGQSGETPPKKISEPVPLSPMAAAIPSLKTEHSQADSIGLAATPRARALARSRHLDLASVVPAGLTSVIHGADVERAAALRPRATPLARCMADAMGVNLDQLQGSGFGGKIVKEDILHSRAADSVPAEPPQMAVLHPKKTVLKNQIPLSSMRRVISQRMLASHTEIPPVTAAVKVDMTELLLLREKVNRRREKTDRISVNDFLIKAVSQSLLRHERFRMTLQGESYALTEQVNIGIAVAVDDGLLVPVIRQTTGMSVSEISREAKRLAGLARSGGLKPEDLRGGCITISNLGMYGTYAFTPIINQPEASIIGACAIEDELVLMDGQVSVRKKMILCTTYDHRIINGAEASLFQADLKSRLENPVDILI